MRHAGRIVRALVGESTRLSRRSSDTALVCHGSGTDAVFRCGAGETEVRHMVYRSIPRRAITSCS